MRLKPGLFILIPLELGKVSEYTGNPLIIGREIMNNMNYFISYASAMQIHEMITQPQLIFYITALTARRPIKMHGLEFRFIHSQKKYFFGLMDSWITKQERVTVSDLEKTIIDCLKQPEYCGGLTEIAKGFWIRRQDINVNKLIKYALRMNTGAVIRRLGFLMELYQIGNRSEQEMLHKYLTETYVRLDPLLPWEGNYLRKWRLQINVSQEELLAVVRSEAT